MAPRPSIADGFADLLWYLPSTQQQRLLARLIHGFYEDWRPSREQVADLMAVDLGVLTDDAAHERDQQRRRGNEPSSITPPIRALHRARGAGHRGPDRPIGAW